MAKYVNDTKAAKSISAYLLLRDGKYVGKLLTHYGDSGRVFVNLWIDDYRSKGSSCLYGSAGGWGYDKQAHALAMAIRSITERLTEWNKDIDGYDTEKVSFNADKIDGYGPSALEEIFNCKVIQAI